MATLTIPAGGGQICLEVQYTQDYECEDGSSGTYNCVASCEDISWAIEIDDEYKEYVTWNPSTCCLSSTWDGGQGDCVKIGELTADVEVNGEPGSSTVEIYQGDCGEDPVCEYGPVVVNLYFDKMPYTGGYSSRVCANYSYSQTNTLCAGGTETLTDGGILGWEFTTPYGATSMTAENDTMCLVGPANDEAEERVVSEVKLTVTMPDGTVGSASYDVIQGYTGCNYSDYSVKFTNADGTAYSSIVFDSEGGTQCIRLHVYATETCGDGSVTENVDVTSMMDELELGQMGDGFSIETDPDNPQNGICITAEENESESDRSGNACITFFSPSYVSSCIEVVQRGVNECTYSDYRLEFKNSDGTVCDSLTIDSEGGTECFKWYVYATETCSDGTVTENVDVTSMMTGYNFVGNNDYFSVVRDSIDSTHGICVTAQANETEDSRSACAGISIFSPTELYGCVGVTQSGINECVYEDIDLSSFSYPDVSVCGGTTSPRDVCYQYKTCNGVRSCNEDLQVSYSWASHILRDAATLDTATGEVTVNEENLSSADSREVGIVRITAQYEGFGPVTADYTIIQNPGGGCETYENPVIDSLVYSGLPANPTEKMSPMIVCYQTRVCDGERKQVEYNSLAPDGAVITYTITPLNNSNATIDEDGAVICDPNEGSNEREVGIVHAQITWWCHDSEVFDATVWQDGTDYECTYDTPTINLEYETYAIPYQGGEFCPTFSYSQHYKCTDGDEGYITDGAEVEWNIDTSLRDYFKLLDDGCIWVDSSEMARDLGTVTVSVTLNDKTATETVTFTQAGEIAGEWGYPQVSVNYPNIPQGGGSTTLTMNVTSYKYDESGNVVDTRTLSIVGGKETYNDYGDDMTMFSVDMADDFVGGTIFDDDTYEIKQTGVNTAGTARKVCDVVGAATAFGHYGEDIFEVYQDGETETYIADSSTSSQYTALIGTIENRSLAEIQVYADRYENGSICESGVLIAQFGYESSHILNNGDVFYGHFIDGIHCGDWQISKLGLRGYNEQGFPQYFPDPPELRIDNNYTGDLANPSKIESYSTEIPHITITNSGPNCELDFYHISYNS